MKAKIRGGEVFYEAIGHGRALFVVHGGPGIDHTCFRPWLDPLADEARVVYSDLLGNGRSDRVALSGGMELWADGIDELRASLGVDRMVLLGHSFGGFVAQEYALRHGAHLDGLVLCATGPGIADTQVLLASAQARATPEQLAAVIKAFTEPAKDDAEMRAGWNAVLPLYFHRLDPAIGAAMDAKTIYSAAALDFGFGQCLPSWKGAARLDEIDVPTLIVNGADDWIMPLACSGELLRDGIAKSKLVVMKESGHFPFIEEQAAFLATVRAWLATLRAG